jgi:hypothetical protein
VTLRRSLSPTPAATATAVGVVKHTSQQRCDARSTLYTRLADRDLVALIYAWLVPREAAACAPAVGRGVYGIDAMAQLAT